MPGLGRELQIERERQIDRERQVGWEHQVERELQVEKPALPHRYVPGWRHQVHDRLHPHGTAVLCLPGATIAWSGEPDTRDEEQRQIPEQYPPRALKMATG